MSTVARILSERGVSDASLSTWMGLDPDKIDSIANAGPASKADQQNSPAVVMFDGNFMDPFAPKPQANAELASKSAKRDESFQERMQRHNRDRQRDAQNDLNGANALAIEQGQSSMPGGYSMDPRLSRANEALAFFYKEPNGQRVQFGQPNDQQNDPDGAQAEDSAEFLEALVHVGLEGFTPASMMAEAQQTVGKETLSDDSMEEQRRRDQSPHMV